MVDNKSSASGWSKWGLAALLFALTTINFADRGVLGVVAPVLRADLHLSIAQFGVVASGFGWGYSVFVFLSGLIVARLGPRRTILGFVSLWSLFIASIAFAWSFGTLVLARILFGAAEGAVFPASNQLIGEFYSREETGRATAVMTTGLPVGSLVIVPLAVWLTDRLNWRASFIVLGVIGALWVLAAHAVIRPKRQRLDERPAEAEGPRRVPWLKLLTDPTILLAGLGFFSSAYVLYFMLNFFPTYLVKERGVPFSAVAILGTAPWIAMALGALSSGFISDALYKKTGSLRISRAYFAGGSLVLTGMFIFISTHAANTSLIIVLLSVGCFTNFLANSVFFAITVDAAPAYAGPASAITNGIGSLAGILSPLLTGYLVQASGSFASAFFLATGVVVIPGVLIAFGCRLDRPNPAVISSYVN